jgi:hypothetical protein
MADPRTLSPLNLIPERIIQDLWGIGFTIVPRLGRDPFEASGLAPSGMVYEWKVDWRTANGWQCVPASRHPGLFAPYGYADNIEVGGLWLMERPKAEVDAFHAEARAKAQKNVDDWFDRQGAAGFTGGVTVLTEGSNGRDVSVTEIGDGSPRQTKIPRELYDHLPALMAERDRLMDAAVQASIAPKVDWALKDTCLKQAIENLTARLAEGANHEQRTDDERPVEVDAGASRNDG